MIIEELFATLGLKPDHTWSRGEKMLAAARAGAAGVGRAVNAALAPLQQFGALIGGAAIAAGARDTLNFEEGLVRLGIASRGLIGSLDDVRDRVLAVSSETGAAKDEVLAAARGFISLTGDADATKQSLELFAKVSQGTGAVIDDVTKSAAALQQNLGVDPSDFEQAFSILIASGKAGKIELGDMARTFADLAPSMAQFLGGKDIQGVARLGALYQVGAQAFGSAEKTSTAFRDFVASVQGNAKKFRDLGINVFTRDAEGREVLKEPAELIKTISKAGLGAEKLKEAFGSIQGLQIYRKWAENIDVIEQLTEATKGANDVAEDYAKWNDSLPARIQAAWNSVKNIVTKAFIGIAKHADFVGVIITGLTASFVILQWAAVKAAAITAASWALTLAPFLVLGLAIAAAILVVEDLWTALSGGESAIGWLSTVGKEFDVFFSAVDKRVRALIRAVGSLLGKFTSLGGWFRTLGGMERALAGVRNRGGVKLEGFIEDKPEWAKPIRRVPAGVGSGKNTTVNANIQVNAPNADPEAVGREVKRQLDAEVRRAEAATGE